MSESEYSVTLHGETVPFRLVRKDRQKHIYLRINELGRLTVSAPETTDMASIESILQSRSVWITEHLVKFRKKLESLDTASTILYCGKTIRVVTTHPGSEKPFLDMKNGVLYLPENKPVGAWLRGKAERILRFRTARIAERTGISFTRLSIRNQRARWGSSSTSGNISINWRAVMAPPEVQRYLIIHELVHRIHPNHSRAFWKNVSELCPEYKPCGRWLKQHGVLTGLFREESRAADA